MIFDTNINRPSKDEICIRLGCKKRGETYFVCNDGNSKFPICYEHIKELRGLIARL